MTKQRRVLLKLSGEALAGEKKTGFDESIVRSVAGQIRKAAADGIQVAIVIGGGNFWRGRTSSDIDRVKADQIGMLATVMNCLYTSAVFNAEGLETEVYSAFTVGTMTRPYDRDAALRSLGEGRIVFFAGGIGNPYFSTDTGVVLRAVEMKADEILLAKAVDGIYDSDPKQNPAAKKYEVISIEDVVAQKLGVMDLTASILSMENRMPMAVFGLEGEDSIYQAMKGHITGTRVTV